MSDVLQFTIHEIAICDTDNCNMRRTPRCQSELKN